jgi:hypothetical protein
MLTRLLTVEPARAGVAPWTRPENIFSLVSVMRCDEDVITLVMQADPETEQDGAVFHPAGDGCPYATVELDGTRVGLYREGSGLVVALHPAFDAPPLTMTMNDDPLFAEEAEP